MNYGGSSNGETVGGLGGERVFTFAGKHMTKDFGLRAKKIERSLGPSIDAITEKIPGRRGVSDQGIEEDALEIKVSFSYQALNAIDLRAHLRQVWAWLRNGGQLGELVFDDEPDLKYVARITGLTELEEIIARSEGEITFLIPDPDALGKMDEQRIAGLGVGNVDSTASDFAKGTLSNVTTEVRAGQTDLILSKYGDPWQSEIKDDWDQGDMNGAKNENGKLTLERSAGAHLKLNSTATWNGSSEKNNTKVESNKLVLSNLPTYYFQDDLSTWKSTGWNDKIYPNPKGKVTQETGFMRLNKTGTGNDSTVMVVRNRGVQAEDRTILIRVRTNTAGCRFQMIDAGKLWNVWLPNTADEWTWFRVDYSGLKTATLYQLGNNTPLETVEEGTQTNGADRFAFILGDAETGQVDVDALYYGKTTSFPDPSVTNLSGYARYTLDLSEVGSPSSAPITYSWSKKSGVLDDPQMVAVRSRIHHGEEVTEWEPVTNFSQVPDLSANGPYGEGDFLELEVELTTTDMGYSPDMMSLEVNIDSAYERSGTWKMTYTDFRYIERAARSKITFDSSIPSGTTLEVLATWEIGGEKHGPLPCTSENPIPYLTSRRDLSDTTLEIQVSLTTESDMKSPSLSLLQLEIEPGYVPDGSRIAPGVDIGVVEEVGSSRIWWEDENPDPSKCSIEVFVSYDGEDWAPAVNGAEIPGAETGTDITGKTLYVRANLHTSDPTLTPRLQVIGWDISQETKTDLVNEGTAPADAIFSGSFSSPAEYIQILHIQSGRRITLNHPFEAGDEVEIDCERGRVAINGSARDGQTAMSFSSRWIEVHPGYNSFEVTPSGVGEFFCEWRERWL
ncbi:distal tail protein Dit [Kroppenstedtia sanguinis]|uniref:Distal tail protein Dit n=1 Tax=Kroppenstedtia sanguinis TaxID=1380684 RepID=A0ABW4C622_9BACL